MSKMFLSAPVGIDRSCPPNADLFIRTTTGRSGYDSEQGEYCWSTTPVLRQKKVCKYRFGEELPYLFDNSSLLQDSILLKASSKGNLGALFLLPPIPF